MSWTSTARNQAGLISRAQLVAAGVAPGTVDGWLATRRLEACATQGVYRVAGSADSEVTASWFAVLASRSPLSFLSAARWWDMPVEADGLVHITRYDRKRLAWPRHVRVHRVALSESDVVEHRGLAVTGRVVTALDCVGWLSTGRGLTFAHRAVQQRWLALDDIRRRLDESPGRWGNARLRRALVTIEKGAEAESERRLHRLLRAAGITGWVAQQPIATAAGIVRADLAFVSRRLIVEVDGYAYHSRDDRFQGDRTKQNALSAAGWRILRFTWADIVDRPDYVIASIIQLLAA